MDPDEQAEQAAATELSGKRIIPKAAREAAAQAGVTFVGDYEDVMTPEEIQVATERVRMTNISPSQPTPGAASAVKVVMDALVDLRTRIDALEQWASEVQAALTFQAGQIDSLQKRPTGQPRPKPARDAG